MSGMAGFTLKALGGREQLAEGRERVERRRREQTFDVVAKDYCLYRRRKESNEPLAGGENNRLVMFLKNTLKESIKKTTHGHSMSF